jgi:YhcH/YjgK/YiaL family protein
MALEKHGSKEGILPVTRYLSLVTLTITMKGTAMILDILENANKYADLHKGFAEAFTFLQRPDLIDLPVGRYEIDGERVFALVSREHGQQREEGQLETHEEYVDIQFVLEGTDEMGWKPKALCKEPVDAYDPKTDLQFFTDEPHAWVPTAPGMFVVFFPEEAHLPLISEGELHKVVVKVAV